MLLGDQLTQICAELKQTSLLITHNISEAVQLSDRVVMLSFRPGRIIDVIPVDSYLAKFHSTPPATARRPRHSPG